MSVVVFKPEQPIKTLLLIVISAREYSFLGFFLYFYVIFLHTKGCAITAWPFVSGDIIGFFVVFEEPVVILQLFLSS